MCLHFLDISQVMINPFAPLFAENRVLKLVELFSGTFWTIKSQRIKMHETSFPGQAIGGLLLQMQNISF